MRRCLSIISVIFLLATSLIAQQCSKGTFQLFQDDVTLSGPCNLSLISGDIITVREIQGYNISCSTTDGNINPGNVYFSQSVSLTGNGARFCGTVMSAPFNCDPVFSMTATQATSVTDFNRFTFFEKDRTTGGAECVDLGSQQIFRQCAGQPCDGTGGANGCDPTATSDFGTVQDQPTNCDPVVLDLGGLGDRFDLTDAANGVRFDIRATGRPLQIPWTAKDSRTAFLVLDRNHNGVIDDGTELFSNVTPQLPSSAPNGFKALAQYDTAELGGNGDWVLDSRDSIFSSLRLWIDANHDGISQPGELYTLPEMGVTAISLNFERIGRRDANGNLFVFRTNVRSSRGSAVAHTAYDVFFVTPK
jgi:hypothetical protein